MAGLIQITDDNYEKEIHQSSDIWCVTFRIDQTVDHFVPVDTDSGIHKLSVELVFNYKCCIITE